MHGQCLQCPSYMGWTTGVDDGSGQTGVGTRGDSVGLRAGGCVSAMSKQSLHRKLYIEDFSKMEALERERIQSPQLRMVSPSRSLMGRHRLANRHKKKCPEMHVSLGAWDNSEFPGLF